MRNADVADLLDQIADLLALKGDDHFRVQAYHDAARTVRAQGEDIAEIARTGRLETLPGIGTSIAKHISEYLPTGTSPYLAELEKQVPKAAVSLMQVPGIGPRRAKLLVDKLQVQSIDDLIKAAEAHQIRTVPGLGAKSEEAILREARRATQRSQRLPLYVAWPLADTVADMLRGHPAVEQVEPAGSIRRRLDTIGDIDLLVASRDPAAVFAQLPHLPIVDEILAQGPTKATILTWAALQVDIRIVDPETWGAALQYFTGSKAHNIHLRTLAIGQGLKLSEYGLFRSDTNERLAGATEAEIYERLGLALIPPEIREDQGEIEAARAGTLPELIALSDIRGDFHTHSTYSDGRDSIEAMARAAMALGYEWLVLTDHSYGLPVAQGLTKEKALRQRAEIADLNRQLAPFRILQGVELEIRKDGSLDFSDDFLATFDLVGASLHMPSKDDGERNTSRLQRAMEHPPVMGLNHPTGRIVGRRDSYDVDIERVIQTAAQRHKVLEINGSERLDLSAELARRASEQGIVFTLSSDAHSTDGLQAMAYAVAQARRAWLSKGQVLNSLSADELLARYGAGGGRQLAA